MVTNGGFPHPLLLRYAIIALPLVNLVLYALHGLTDQLVGTAFAPILTEEAILPFRFEPIVGARYAIGTYVKSPLYINLTAKALVDKVAGYIPKCLKVVQRMAVYRQPVHNILDYIALGIEAQPVTDKMCPLRVEW